MDEYAQQKVFSSIDRQGRYAYGNQPAIVHWNLARLAECLLVLDEDLAGFQAALDRCPAILGEEYQRRMGAKLGLRDPQPEDSALVEGFLEVLEEGALDFTVSFRTLADRVTADDTAAFGEWEHRWRARLAEQGDTAEATRARMNSVNPAVIPRNHQVERAIQAAFAGDFSVFQALHEALQRPFELEPGKEEYALPPDESERVTRTFCGT